MPDEFNGIQLNDKVYYINNFDSLKTNRIDASNSSNTYLEIYTKGSSGETINFGITAKPSKVYNLDSFDNLISGGDINSETAFFDSIRATTGVPAVGSFVKAGRQTTWTSDKLPGMENLFNPFIAFGGGDAQGFMMVSYANQRAVIGGGNGDGFRWTKELATCDWVNASCLTKSNTKVVGTTLVIS